MHAETGSVFHIQKFSLHDGRGIRTTVFLKGCPLQCWWCHNPESLSDQPQRVFRQTRCMRCGQCVAACGQDALHMADAGPQVATDLCVLDGACAAVCPTGATEILGFRMTVEDVMAVVQRDVPFFEDSGGGATFSGGEPLQQPHFLEALLLACRDSGIHTTVDTSGHAEPEVLLRIAELTDAVLYDIKLLDSELHRRYTGIGNELILENARRLAAMCAERGTPHLTVRMPLIAGINDDDAAVDGVAGFVASLDNQPPIDLLPYQWFGESKYDRLRVKYRMTGARPPAPERLEEIVERFSAAGLDVSVRGEDQPCQ